MPPKQILPRRQIAEQMRIEAAGFRREAEDAARTGNTEFAEHMVRMAQNREETADNLRKGNLCDAIFGMGDYLESATGQRTLDPSQKYSPGYIYREGMREKATMELAKRAAGRGIFNRNKEG